MKHLLTFFSFLILSSHLFASAADSFDWKKATVYFVITDRFCNGDSLNDVNYGRKTDYGSERMNAATFQAATSKGCSPRPAKAISAVWASTWSG